MGFWDDFFGAGDNPKDTISGKKAAELRKKAEHAQKIRGGMFSKKAVADRKANSDRLSKWMWN